MIKSVLIFILVWLGFVIAIPEFRNLTGAEKWEVAKTISYSFVCALLALFVLGIIVAVF
jgi:hypothetical protein